MHCQVLHIPLILLLLYVKETFLYHSAFYCISYVLVCFGYYSVQHGQTYTLLHLSSLTALYMYLYLILDLHLPGLPQKYVGCLTIQNLLSSDGVNRYSHYNHFAIQFWETLIDRGEVVRWEISNTTDTFLRSVALYWR